MEALAAAAVVVATASIACGNAATVVTAAAEEDEYKDDDPRAISAKTVVTHTVSLLLFISISSYGVRQVTVTASSTLT